MVVVVILFFREPLGDAIRSVACQAIFDQIADFPDGGFDILFTGLGERQTKCVVPAAVHEKGLTGDKGYILFHRTLEKFTGIHVFWKFYENEKASLGSIPGRLPGEMPVHLRQHKISLGTVEFDVLLNLPV